MPNPNDEKLVQFVEDEVMFAAVRGIVMAQFDANTLIDIPRSERDTALQAILDGRPRVEQAFKDIAKFKRDTDTKSAIPNYV